MRFPPCKLELKPFLRANPKLSVFLINNAVELGLVREWMHAGRSTNADAKEEDDTIRTATIVNAVQRWACVVECRGYDLDSAPART